MPVTFPKFIFGIHDPGAWMDPVQSSGKQGWVLITEGIGCDPNENSGTDYSQHSNRGFAVVVRLNNGYGGTGTIPKPDQYDHFAQRCANWVRNSRGAGIWIIGNEMNLAGERPGGQDEANKITPGMYAACYRRCRECIKAIPGHADDLVLVGAVAPYNIQTAYPGNPNGDWVQYFQDILSAIGPNCDGMALHAYTMGPDSALVTSEETFPDPRFKTRRKHFRTYRDFMSVIPDALRALPVFITEAQSTPDSGGWTNTSLDWIQRAYGEIELWNSDPVNQPIQCLLLFRWHDDNHAWRIDDKPGVLNDFVAAVQNNYRVRPPGPPPKLYRATISGDTAPAVLAPDAQVSIGVSVQNDSNFVWRATTQPNPVRFGYRWFDTSGKPVPVRADLRTALPKDIEPGERLSLSGATLVAPASTGRYVARLDMLEEGASWFTDRGSPAHNVSISVARGEYAVAWLGTPLPAVYTRAQIMTVPLTFRNDGRKAWPASGDRRVRLTCRWYDPGGAQVLVTQDIRASLPRDVLTGDVVTSLNLDVLAPEQPGIYKLKVDLVEEGVTYFQDQGSAPLESTVTVQGTQDYQVTFDALSPLVVSAGQIQCSLRLRNDGRKSWNAAEPNPIRIGYHWFDANNQPVAVSQDLRTALPRDVAVGEYLTLLATTVTPKDPGKYRLQWSPVREGLAWFYELGARVLDVPVEVRAPGGASPVP